MERIKADLPINTQAEEDTTAILNEALGYMTATKEE